MNGFLRALRPTAALAMLILSGCGGGDDAAATPQEGAGAVSGVLTDAPLAGVSYTARSGPSDTTVITGITKPDGTFSFDPGDIVTFKIGNITIAELPAQETITPREIAAELVRKTVAAGGSADFDNVVSNLFVFFQSLDTDDDPNTITVPTPGQIADVNFTGLAGVDVTDPASLFNVSPQQFAVNMAEVVTTIVETVPALAAVIEVVDVEEALQHATEQTRLLLSGTWRLRSERPNGDGEPLAVDLAFTFFPNGTYLKGGLENGDCSGQPGTDTACNGAEFGTYNWDPLSGELSTGTPAINTDGDSGLGNAPEGDLALQVNGSELRLFSLVHPEGGPMTEDQCADDAGTFGSYVDGEAACIFTLTRAENEPTTIVGSFGGFTFDADSDFLGPTVLTIERTGANSYRYILVEANKGRNTPVTGTSDDTTDGVEIGTFTLNSAGETQGAIVASVDTNDAGGLENSDDTARGFRFTVESGKLRLEELESEGAGDSLLIDRLPLLPAIQASQLVGGTWHAIFGEDFVNGVTTPDADPNLKTVTYFADGDYLLGSQENDADCTGGNANGNGIEYGTFELDTVTGIIRSSVPAPVPGRRYVDTNGGCGPAPQGESPSEFYLQRVIDADTILELFLEPTPVSGADFPAGFFDVDTLAEAAAFTGSGFDYTVLKRLPSQGGALLGSWRLSASDLSGDSEAGRVSPVVINFLPGDKYFLSHGSSGTDTVDGIERGSYQWLENGQFCVQDVLTDTTADAGLSSDGASSVCGPGFVLTLAADGRSFAFNFEEDGTPASVTFSKISKD